MSKIGMFNKSFSAMKQDLSSGLGIGFSIFGGQAGTKSDKQAILDYNTALQGRIDPIEAFETTMSKASAVAQEQARKCVESGGSLTDLANGLKTTTLAAQGTQFALQALSSIGNMALIWLISEKHKGAVLLCWHCTETQGQYIVFVLKTQKSNILLRILLFSYFVL